MTSHSFQHEILEHTFPVEGRRKGKVVPVFNYAIKHCSLTGMEEWVYSSTIIDLCAGWRRSSQLQTPATLPPRDRAPATHCIGGLLAPELVWVLWGKQKFLAPAGNPNP
jgi:hypothetical protein